MPEHSSIKIGQIFRVPYRGQLAGRNGLASYQELTRGIHEKSADLQKGMFFYQHLPERGQDFARIPAFIFHSNPFKSGGEGSPWVDVIEPDAGYCLFHGDNRKPGASPLSSRGNARFAQAQNFYADPTRRKFAPPVLVFKQVEFDGNNKGHRQFCGFGVPVRQSIGVQKDRRAGYFTNLVIELVLFRMERENETFSWKWIDDRRNPEVDADSALRGAPASWKQWVSDGDLAIEGCRRYVARETVVAASEQITLTNDERRILKEVVYYYSKQRHHFEALASFVTQRILGQQCRRGWVTKRSGDGGIDFVCRLDVGDPADRLSQTSAVVLGQAKCVGMNTSVGGSALARVVARLQRGWIGAFVTTGSFSRAAQLELAQDRYPVVLVNGRRLARAVFEVLTQERIELRDLLDRETDWYTRSLSHLSPQRILEDAFGFATSAASQDSKKHG
jgi:Restriction endonuclease AspBHI N-terminal/Restriction endonuclease